MKKIVEQLIDKKIAILGYGVNNQNLLEWLFKHGAKDITLCDKNIDIENNKIVKELKNKLGLKTSLGEDYMKDLNVYDVVFRTPGIPYLHKEIQRAKNKGVYISSQTELFLKICPAKVIGVTGTKGKGTTSTLIYEILKKSNESRLSSVSNIFLGGNIGKDPFEFIDEVDKEDIVILELSSFQLQGIDVSPNISVVLNITSDHLDHHKDVDEYRSAKENIVRFQKEDDFSVINMDYNTSFKFAEASPSANDYYFSVKKSVDLGVYIKWNDTENTSWGTIVYRDEKEESEIIKTYDIKIVGKHNLENICAAVCASRLAGASFDAIRESIKNFTGLKHRIELVGERDGVRYFNDSASTNPDTTSAAINAFHDPVVLILGGSSKNAKYDSMVQRILESSVKAVVSMGDTGKEIVGMIKDKGDKKIEIYEDAKSMKEAVEAAKKISSSGDVVLLSPASASFGMFKNYQDRGDQFRENVNKSND